MCDNTKIPFEDETPLIEQEGQEIPDSAGQFLEKYRIWAVILIFIMIIGLMVYILYNVEFMKASPTDYCQKVLHASRCVCIP